MNRISSLFNRNSARQFIPEVILFSGSLIVALRIFFPPHYMQLADRQGYVNRVYLPTEEMMTQIKQNGYYQFSDYIIGTLHPDYSAALWQSVAISVVTLVMFIVLKRWVMASNGQTKQ